MNPFMSDKFKEEMPEQLQSFIQKETELYMEKFLHFMMHHNPKAMEQVYDLVHESIAEDNLNHPDQVFMLMLEVAVCSINKAMRDFAQVHDEKLHQSIADGTFRKYCEETMKGAKRHHKADHNDCPC